MRLYKKISNQIVYTISLPQTSVRMYVCFVFAQEKKKKLHVLLWQFHNLICEFPSNTTLENVYTISNWPDGCYFIWIIIQYLIFYWNAFVSIAYLPHQIIQKKKQQKHSKTIARIFHSLRPKQTTTIKYIKGEEKKIHACCFSIMIYKLQIPT